MWLKRCVTSLVVIAYIAISLLLLAFETAPYMRLYQQKTTLHQGMRSPTWLVGTWDVLILPPYTSSTMIRVCVWFIIFLYISYLMCVLFRMDMLHLPGKGIGNRRVSLLLSPDVIPAMDISVLSCQKTLTSSPRQAAVDILMNGRQWAMLPAGLIYNNQSLYSVLVCEITLQRLCPYFFDTSIITSHNDYFQSSDTRHENAWV